MASSTQTTITIATYNILADAYVKPEYFPQCDLAELDAGVRYPRVVKRVAGLNADVVCLQEVDHQMFRLLSAKLIPLGYRGRWAHKDGAKPDGVATFVRLPWRLTESRIVSLSDLTAPDASGHVALFTHLWLGKEDLVVANIHLKWDQPDLADAHHAGYAQALAFCKALDPWGLMAVCGDFNAGPQSAILEAFRREQFVDPHCNNEPTCSHNGLVSKIDYVLVRGDNTGRVYITAQLIPQVSAQNPVPSASEPSDHVPVMATIHF